MSDLMLNKQTYQNKLKTREDLNNIDADQMLNHVSQTPDLLEVFDKETYRIQYENREDFLEGQQVLISDEALVSYYEKKDPTMLKGLKSKSRINVVGKKSEKKKLRKKYIEAHSVQNREAELIQEKRQKLAKERKKEGWQYNDSVEELKDMMLKEDTDKIMSYYNLTNKSADELKLVKKRVEGLSIVRRQQLLNITNKLLLDADEKGMDGQACIDIQDKYAKKKCKFATYKAYRLLRDRKKYADNHQMPDDAMEKLEKSKFKGRNELYKRTTSVYMKEVNYHIVDGKKIPKSAMDEENLKYNNKFLDSVLSDKKEDREFRQKELEKNLEDTWSFYEKDIKAYVNGKFNLNEANFDYLKVFADRGKLLCFSGVDFDDNSSLFKSDYAKNRTKERQDEILAKADILSQFLCYISSYMIKQGVDDNGEKFLPSRTPVEAYEKSYLGVLEEKLTLHDEYVKNKLKDK